MDASSLSPVTALTPTTLQWCVSILSNSNIWNKNAHANKNNCAACSGVQFHWIPQIQLNHLHLWFLLMLMHQAHLAYLRALEALHRPNAPPEAILPIRLCSWINAFYQRCPQPTPNRRYIRNNCANTSAMIFGRQHPRNWVCSFGVPVCLC